MQKYLRWNIVGPVALLAAALLAVAWLDISTGGDAKPRAPIGETGTPVRYAFVEPTGTPLGAKPTGTATRAGVVAPTAVPQAQAKGTPADRDAQRRADLLRLLDAVTKLRDKDGRFPDTNNNVQSICVYKDRDQLCHLDEFLGGPPPEDPLGAQNGYWYSGTSDGQSMKLFAALEGSVAADPKCTSPDEVLNKRPNVICIVVP